MREGRRKGGGEEEEIRGDPGDEAEARGPTRNPRTTSNELRQDERAERAYGRSRVWIGWRDFRGE